MGRLTNDQYKLDISKIQMKKFGFRYDYELDDYIYKFPVHRYKNLPLIFCRLGVEGDTKKVWFTVCDSNNTAYPPYYDREYGRNAIVSRIEDAILIELNKLGAAKVD